MSQPRPTDPSLSAALAARTQFRGGAAVLAVMGVALLLGAALPSALVSNDGGEGDLTLAKFAIVDAATGVLLALGGTLVVGSLACLAVAAFLSRGRSRVG